MAIASERSDTLSVAIIDDHDVVHAGIEAWCQQADFAVAFAGNYFSIEAFTRDYPSGCAELDVVLFDLELQSRQPDFTALQQICAAGHRVIVYSHIPADEVIMQCLEYGAMTYLVKSEGRKHLLDALRAARTDTPYIGPQMARAMLNDREVGRPTLAAREKEVLIAWFQTESKDLVAEKLFIAPSTVRTHLQRIRAKYAAVGRAAPTKAALVARAIQDGIVGADDL